MILKFKVNNQVLRACNTEQLANKSNNYLELKFYFCTPDWEDKLKFCLLRNTERKTYQFPIDPETNTVVVPGTILTGDKFLISLYGGRESNERITTNVCNIKLVESGYTEEVDSITYDEVDIWLDVYAKLADKIGRGSVDAELSPTSENPIQNKAVNNALNGKADSVHTHYTREITDFPDLAIVALTGDYDDLTDKPTIPSKTSQLTNDAGFLTEHQDISGKVNVSDIVDNTTTAATNKPLSANQGKVLKDALDGKAASSHGHGAGEVTDSNAHSNLGTSANATQASINTAIDSKIGALLDVELIEVVSSLPTASAETMNKLYCVAESTSQTHDNYEIYITIKTGNNYAWEKVDTARIDLSGKADVDHVHGNISNDGKVGSTSGKPLITGTGGLVSAGEFGTTSGTVAEGNHTHAYSEITNAPTDVSDLTDNNNTQFTPKSHGHVVNDISDFPATMPPSSHTHSKNDINNVSLVSVTVTYTDNTTATKQFLEYTGS